MQENAGVDVRDKQHPKRREAARPARWDKFGFGQLKAFLQQPAIRIPKRREVRIDKSRNENIRVALQHFDQAAVGIDAPALPAGDKTCRAELSSLDNRNEKSPGSGVFRCLLIGFRQSSDNRKEVSMQGSR